MLDRADFFVLKIKKVSNGVVFCMLGACGGPQWIKCAMGKAQALSHLEYKNKKDGEILTRGNTGLIGHKADDRCALIGAANSFTSAALLANCTVDLLFRKSFFFVSSI